ncbi:hypothetical protein BAnh1_09780 [Bartonella australis AUST/NH1]|uniref:Uncharacterized protein n=1 Tax=Bartonella australis (strain Aust/NH1) TaxID=1094489 RepID=M1P4R8_BARAA|nr:hypothetical protein [Bartonella australis]AGF74850.1 hypothetical protein BAnh1_09780 [Bartonella australis AUST/NH1]
MLKIAHLLKIIDAYRIATGLTDSSVSTYVFNSGKRICNLRKGRGIEVKTFNHAFYWFSDHWPEGVQWPSDIPRPSLKEESVPLSTKALKQQHQQPGRVYGTDSRTN